MKIIFFEILCDYDCGFSVYEQEGRMCACPEQTINMEAISCLSLEM